MRTRTLAAPLLGLTLVLAACSSSGGATTAPSAAPASVAPSEVASEAPSASAAASPSASAAAGGAVTVNLATTSLGSVLTGADGKTLYIFTPDAASAGKSVCNGDCAASWPPLLGDAPTLGTGLDAEDFTTITRDDGATQIAFYGQPLYYFAADAAAGDVKGQGLNDKWYVVDAEGKPVN